MGDQVTVDATSGQWWPPRIKLVGRLLLLLLLGRQHERVHVGQLVRVEAEHVTPEGVGMSAWVEAHVAGERVLMPLRLLLVVAHVPVGLGLLVVRQVLVMKRHLVVGLGGSERDTVGGIKLSLLLVPM